MNAYHFATPRAVIGFAALAMTAANLALSVVVPAALASHRDGPPAVLATANPWDRAVSSIDRMHIDVVGVRERATAFVPVPRTLPKQSGREG